MFRYAYCALAFPEWCWLDKKTGQNYYNDVTARELLSQVSGRGRAAPATQFSYDSDIYISRGSWAVSFARFACYQTWRHAPCHTHGLLTAAVADLSYLLGTVTGEAPVSWATREYAIPMGMQRLFAFDGFGDDISAGGGQMMTCRDHLRVGQLLLNNGMWKNATGQPARLVSEPYVQTMVHPTFTDISTAYGLLTWLNAPASAKECCAPRWCSPHVPPYNASQRPWAGISGASNLVKEGTGILGDNVGDIGAPPDVALGLGANANYLYHVPQANITVVTLGMSHGATVNCPLGYYGTNSSGSRLVGGGYDEGWTASELWRAFAGALALPPSPPPAPAHDQRGRDTDVQHGGTEMPGLFDGIPARPAWTAAKSAHQHAEGGEVAPVWQRVRRGPVNSPRTAEPDVAGACYQYCPPDLGFGYCFVSLTMGSRPAPALWTFVCECATSPLPRVTAG